MSTNAKVCGQDSANASALTSVPCRDESLKPCSAPGKCWVNVAPRGRDCNAVCRRPNVCVSSVVYPAPGQTGFTGGGNTALLPPYASSTYTFTTANTTEPGAKTVTTNDEAGNTPLQTPITFKRDVTAPTFASPPTAGGITTGS